jgi:hypothetical protein
VGRSICSYGRRRLSQQDQSEPQGQVQGRPQGNNPRNPNSAEYPPGTNPYTGKWEWKGIPAKKGETSKRFYGQVYVPCPNHGNCKWVLKEGHINGCKFDSSNKGSKVGDGNKLIKPTADELIMASALASVMKQNQEKVDNEEENDDNDD